jgi:hypothetical protein
VVFVIKYKVEGGRRYETRYRAVVKGSWAESLWRTSLVYGAGFRVYTFYLAVNPIRISRIWGGKKSTVAFPHIREGVYAMPSRAVHVKPRSGWPRGLTLKAA